MTNQTITPNFRRDRGSDAASPIDFALFCEGKLILILPVSEQADDHALEAFSAAMQWGSVYVCQPHDATAIVQDLFAEGFRLSLDGREIVPARRPC